MALENQDVEKFILDRFKQIQLAKVTGQKRSKTIHVSHLVGDCMRKTWYQLNRNELETMDEESLCNFFAGTILHENTPLSTRNEIPVKGNIVTLDKITDVSQITSDNFFDCVTGTIDDVLEINGELVIADKKTCKYLPEKVSQEYVTQVNIYKLLLWITEGVEIQKGAIFYLDKPSSYYNKKVFVFDLMSLQDIRNMVIDKLDQIKQKTEPKRIISYKCERCQFRDECKPFENSTIVNRKE